ncbi:hypothetical protein WDU94_003725 [Cyamophila willieti]
MNIVDSINLRALGFVFKREDHLVDLRLKNLKKDTLLKVADGPLMNVAFDQSMKSIHPRIAVGHEEGQVSIHNLDHENKVKASYRIQSHRDCIFDLVWSHDGEHLYTACGDGTVGYHDVDSETSYISSERVQYFSATRSISMKSVTIHPTNPYIFATGSSGGNIFVWDTRILSKPDVSIKQAYSKETKRKGLNISYGARYINSSSIRSMIFQDSNTLISSCSESSHIKIWDMRRTYCNLRDLPKPMYILDAPPSISGFSCLALDSCLMLLYARAQDSTIQIYDVGTSKKMPVSELPAPSVPKLISFHIKIKLSPDGRHLVAGSSNGTLNLWNTKTRQPLIEPSENPQFEELAGVDWIQTRNQETLICGGSEDGDLCGWTESFAEDKKLIEDPPHLNIQFNQLQMKPKPKRPKTPTRAAQKSDDNDLIPASVDSPTLNLPNFVEDSSNHPVCKNSTPSSKPRTSNNWLANLRREITPKRSPSTASSNSAEKNKGKRSRRRLNSSPGVSLKEFMQRHCKVPQLDSANHPLNK